LAGIAVCPETAVCFECLETLVRKGKIGPDEEVVVFNTGAAQKYPEAVPLALPRIDTGRPVDYEVLVRQVI
jgi:threonine synthase